MATIQAMQRDIKTLQKKLARIERRVGDPDSWLTPKEAALLRRSMDEERQGKTVSGEQLKRELGLP